MLIAYHLRYTHPNRVVLFDQLDLALPQHAKVALTGNNGAGKSTLLKLLAGVLQPAAGHITADSPPYYVPQHFGQYNALTVAQALRVAEPLQALKDILSGDVTASNLTQLNDQWDLEERCEEALAQWQLQGLALDRRMDSLSGGQKTRVFLAGMAIHQPQLILMDEPSNHLDAAAREQLYRFIRTTPAALLIVSHDRTLLNLLHPICELSKAGVKLYGGNYDFYRTQKELETQALDQDIRNKASSLRKARETEREANERQQKLDARGKKKQEKAGLPTISMKTFKNNAEKSTARVKGDQAEKVESLFRELDELRNTLPDLDKMKFDVDESGLHKGKVLVKAEALNTGYAEQCLWPRPLSFEIRSGERLSIQGPNGSGKTTLIRMILGELLPKQGHLYRSDFRAVYIDQDYSLIDGTLTVYEQAERFNTTALQEHEVKLRLNRFLFSKEHWDKPCSTLSGGEKLRLSLCCLTIAQKAPEMILLDEPTNNLDIQNIQILSNAIRDYKGTVLVVSHDVVFLKEIGVHNTVLLEV